MSTLLFAWKVRDRSLLRLIGAFLLLSLFLGGLFLVFRITYPVMQQADATAQRLIVLDPADPAALALIHRAQDKSFGLMPSETSAETIAVTLPGFAPSYQGSRLKLLPMSADEDAPRQPQLLTHATSVLPAVPRRATLPPQTRAEPVLSVLTGPELARRAPEGGLSLRGLDIRDPASLQIRVAIDESGRVVHVLPMLGNELPATLARLKTSLASLRFTAAPKTERTYGTLGFRWAKQKSEIPTQESR
jgi:hypothetical protein